VRNIAGTRAAGKVKDGVHGAIRVGFGWRAVAGAFLRVPEMHAMVVGELAAFRLGAVANSVDSVPDLRCLARDGLRVDALVAVFRVENGLVAAGWRVGGHWAFTLAAGLAPRGSAGAGGAK
jgi:hypothetical protein